MKTKKSRNWSAVIYPDSLPDNWEDLITQEAVQCAISPLHDKDLCEAADDKGQQEPKKAHYHMLICYPGPTTFEVVKGFVQDKLHGALPIVTASVKGTYDYFSHKNNPEKYQYDPKDIRCFNGFVPMDHFDMAKSEVMQLIAKVTDMVIDQQITEYYDLVFNLRHDGLVDEWDIVSNHTLYFNSLCRSLRNKKRDAASSKNLLRFDPDTGEILSLSDPRPNSGALSPAALAALKKS